MNIIGALDHPKIFAGALRNPASWAVWKVFLKALFALPLSDADASSTSFPGHLGGGRQMHIDLSVGLAGDVSVRKGG